MGSSVRCTQGSCRRPPSPVRSIYADFTPSTSRSQATNARLSPRGLPPCHSDRGPGSAWAAVEESQLRRCLEGRTLRRTAGRGSLAGERRALVGPWDEGARLGFTPTRRSLGLPPLTSCRSSDVPCERPPARSQIQRPYSHAGILAARPCRSPARSSSGSHRDPLPTCWIGPPDQQPVSNLAPS